MASSVRGGASSVITFNFDTLLEEYLATLGLVAASVDSFSDWSGGFDLEILHPHGLLPYDRSRNVSSRGIIFTSYDYNEVLGDQGDRWNQRMLDVFSSYTCVFVGLSGEDDRLIQLMQQAQKLHPATLRQGHSYWGVSTMKESEALPDSLDLWQSRGVLVRTFPDFMGIPDWLLTICRLAADLRRTALSL